MWRTEEAKQQNIEERLYVSLTSVVSSLVVDVGEYNYLLLYLGQNSNDIIVYFVT